MRILLHRISEISPGLLRAQGIKIGKIGTFLLPKWLRFTRFREKKEAEANLFFSIKEQDSVLHLE